MPSSVIVNSNGSFFKLTIDGQLEEIAFEQMDNSNNVSSTSANRIGLTQNPASSSAAAASAVETAANSNNSDHRIGLVGMDVHGTRTMFRSKI